jgi:hypothetical protein
MEKINSTPTWESLLPVLIDIICGLSAKQRLKPEQENSLTNIKAELLNMSKAADKWNAYIKLKNQNSFHQN